MQRVQCVYVANLMKDCDIGNDFAENSLSSRIFLIVMKIVMDEKIPFLRDVLEGMGHSVHALAGTAITRGDVRDAGALFVRTRTVCNASLLGDTAVRFVGTATIGYDHIDADWCKRAGVEWTNAPGCNADAVLQYVQSTVYAWAQDRGRCLCGMNIGVIGVGQIGSRVARWARSEGMTVFLNDPPRKARGEAGFVDIDEIARCCDIITLHPTLSYDGDFPSYHLADATFFASLHRCALFINASRGAVADNAALLLAIDKGLVGDVVLDVWENEPKIDIELLNKVYMATPHIAGYSAEGKLNATAIVLDSFLRFTNYDGPVPLLSLPAPEQAVVHADSYSDALLGIYNPADDTTRLKASPSDFENLRNNYTLRREPSAYKIVIGDKNKHSE